MYLEFPLRSRLLIIDFLLDCGIVTVDKDKLLHDPGFAPRGIVFSPVDTLLATCDFALTFGNFEFTIENFLSARTSLLPPTRGSEFLFLYDFLDDRLGRGNIHDGLRGARRALLIWDDATRGTDEKLCFAAGDLGLAHGNVTLTRYENLRTFRIEVAPDASGSLVLACRRCTGRGCGEGEHDGEYGKDQGEDKEESG